MARPSALADQDHFVGGGLSMWPRLARLGPMVGRRTSAADEVIAIEWPRTLRIARMQAADLHPPLGIFLGWN